MNTTLLSQVSNVLVCLEGMVKHLEDQRNRYKTETEVEKFLARARDEVKNALNEVINENK